MTDRFKNKCFNKDATSYLQQAPDGNIFLVQSIFLKKKKKEELISTITTTTVV